MKYTIGDKFKRIIRDYKDKEEYLRIVGLYDRSYQTRRFDKNGVDLKLIGVQYYDFYDETYLDQYYIKIDDFPWANSYGNRCRCSGYDLLWFGCRCK